MKQNWKLIGMTLVLAGISGCASMSGDECASGDWMTIGYEDGARGYTTDRIGQHRKACAKHGIAPDFAAYRSGRKQGLVEYCQPGRGFDIGSNGGSYNGVCSANLEADFLDAYNAGYRLYSLQSDVNRASSSINSRERELERIKADMRSKEAALISGETETRDRIVLLQELKDLSERTGQIESEIKDLYEQRARAQIELESYQVVVVDLGY
ncbi:MAG: DUF2799 domain-containing protein [Gammaproteobacteria bacterium]|nr:DUF2799 domain-containing protein [Gammaproteobacteria bacterium]